MLSEGARCAIDRARGAGASSARIGGATFRKPRTCMRSSSSRFFSSISMIAF